MGYYPTLLGKPGRDGAPSCYIAKSWLERLRVFPLSVVLGAIRRIHEHSDTPFPPRLPKVVAECESLHAFQSGQTGLGLTPRQKLREKLKDRTGCIVEGKRFGRRWRIAQDGLAEVGGTMTIPVADIPTQDLEWIVAQVEPLVQVDISELRRRLPYTETAAAPRGGPQPARQEAQDGSWVEEVIPAIMKSPEAFRGPREPIDDEIPF